MKLIKTEKVRCNLCGENNSSFLFESYDRQYKNPGIFKLVRCHRCGLVYLNPRPRDVGVYYPDDYIPHNLYNLSKDTFPESLTSKFLNSEKYYKKNKNTVDHFFASIFEMVYNPIPPCYSGKVLDVGCGSGISLYNLKKRGWDVYGLDLSEKAVRFVQEELGLKNIFAGTLEDKKYPENFFDVVLLTHVIEHLPNPKKTLSEVKRILRPGGLLLITTPNFACLNAKLFRKYWFPLETPRHLYLFTPKTLQNLFGLVGGLSVIKVRHSLSSYSLGKSLVYLLGNNDKVNQIIMKFKILLLPFTVFLSIMGKSDVFTFYVEKKRAN